MSRMTNPDNGMMENQQADDLGHPLDEATTPAAAGASVESAIPRLSEGVDADGLMEDAQAMPDEASEAARREAIETAEGQPQPRG